MKGSPGVLLEENAPKALSLEPTLPLHVLSTVAGGNGGEELKSGGAGRNIGSLGRTQQD